MATGEKMKNEDLGGGGEKEQGVRPIRCICVRQMHYKCLLKKDKKLDSKQQNGNLDFSWTPEQVR